MFGMELWGFNHRSTFQKKALFFENEFKNNFDAAFFIETHHKTENDFPQSILRYSNSHHIVHSLARGETYSGILGLVSKEYDIIETENLIQGRLFIACQN